MIICAPLSILLLDLRSKAKIAEQNEKADIAVSLIDTGSPTWARTRDTRINSPLLYRLSYRGIDRRRNNTDLAA